LEQRDLRDKCPQCRLILVSNVNSQNGEVTDNWYAEQQSKWLKSAYSEKNLEKIKEDIDKGSKKRILLPTQYREVADYIAFWSSAQGFRPYVSYVPHTEVSTANVSGIYSTYGTDGSTFGNMNGIISVRRTYYTAQTNQWPYVDVNLVVYDKLGNKVYETWHQGNWRWSKPEKDCLVDAFEFLSNMTD
jgi:hypothetical protein